MSAARICGLGYGYDMKNLLPHNPARPSPGQAMQPSGQPWIVRIDCLRLIGRPRNRALSWCWSAWLFPVHSATRSLRPSRSTPPIDAQAPAKREKAERAAACRPGRGPPEGSLAWEGGSEATVPDPGAGGARRGRRGRERRGMGDDADHDCRPVFRVRRLPSTLR